MGKAKSEAPENNGKDRDENGRFVKGNKAATNGGRKKIEFQIQDLIDKAVSPDDWQKIISMQKTQALKGVLESAKWLSDRRFGKAKETIDANVQGGMTIIVQRNTPRPGDTAK